MKTFARISALLVSAAALIGGVGCSKNNLVPLENYLINRQAFVDVEADFCMQQPNVNRQKLKYIFVLDKSSSNQEPPNATDPNGYRRYGPLVNFMATMNDDPGYTYYSLIDFSTTSRVVQSFTDSRTAFANRITSEWNAQGVNQPEDLGYTDYLSALESARNMITADAVAAINDPSGIKTTSIYVVIFISDGAPVVPSSTDPSGVITQATSTINAKIDQLRGLKADPKYKSAIDDVILHTGYYFEISDIAAQSLLAAMAAEGAGKAYTFGAGLNIDYTLFAVPIRKIRHIFTDLLVEDANAVWWDDGRYLRDSDGDGLPDEIEMKLGSNPNERDSDGNGVSDLVEYRIKGKPCKDATCSHDAAKRDNYAICTGLLPALRPDGSPNPAPDGINVAPFGTNWFDDSDHDSLNDCEELILGSLPDQFDSNNDGVMDFLSLKNQLPFIQGVNFASADGDADGVSNYAEIKMGSPTHAPNDKLLNFMPMHYDLNRVDSQNDTDCYHARIEHVSVVGTDSLIRLYLTESASAIDSKKVLRVAEVRMSGIADFIRFVDGDFK